MNKSKCKQYFEGWFYKIVSNDLNNIYAFIPGISKTDDEKAHCFIQILDGVNCKSYNIKYPISSFSHITENTIKIDKNIFSKNGIRLDIDRHELKVSGELLFDDICDIKRNIVSPTAMGFFEYFSFLECKHEVLSMNHTITGELAINDSVFKFKDTIIDFNDGKGYIEKDMGTSFPKNYVWVQCNHFNNKGITLMCSVADIPFIYNSFKGFICILKVNDEEYRFTTYNKSKIINENINHKNVNLTLKNCKYYLDISAEIIKAAPLFSPKNAAMSSSIMESLQSKVTISLYDKNKNLIVRDESSVAGLEIVI